MITTLFIYAGLSLCVLFYLLRHKMFTLWVTQSLTYFKQVRRFKRNLQTIPKEDRRGALVKLVMTPQWSDRFWFGKAFKRMIRREILKI